MFNQSRLPLLPRFIAAVTAGALASTSLVQPALAADPVPAKAPSAAAAPAGGAAAAKPALDKAKPAAPDKKTKDGARKAYGDGEKAYAAGDYAGAVTAFQKANELIPSPHAAYWVAKSLEGQGKTDEAIAAYDKLLADPDLTRIGEDKISDAKLRSGELKAKLVGELNILTLPAGATLSIDGVPQAGETPMTVKLAPGPHKLTIASAGYETKEIEVVARPGEKLEQRVELTTKAPPPAPPPEPAAEPVAITPPPPPLPARSKVPAYITLGIAGAGAVVGTIFGIQALSAKSDFDDKPTGSTADDTERNALIADMAFGVAITLGVTGVVLLTSDDSAPPPAAAQLHRLPRKAQLVVAPYASPRGGGAAARLTF